MGFNFNALYLTSQIAFGSQGNAVTCKVIPFEQMSISAFETGNASLSGAVNTQSKTKQNKNPENL